MSSEDFEHSLKLENENYYYRRIDRHSFFLRKDFSSPFRSVSVDITGSKAIIGTGKVIGGGLYFKSGGDDIEPPSGNFGLYIPPFSIYSSVLAFEQTELAFTVSSEPVLCSLCDVPVLFPTSLRRFDASAQQCGVLRKEMKSADAVYLTSNIPEEAAAVKAVIDQDFTELKSLSELAETFGLENWELTRIFKQGYGLGPLKYLNRLRTIEAVYRLLESGRNSRIIDVAFNVGFRDLSRFNKQFKSCLRFIPRNLLGKKS